eukprot:SAG11_NODE_8026_length_1068_cov_1.220846_2_plen_130_part_00
MSADDQTTDGRTALMRASTNRHTNVVKLLMSRGADPTLLDKFGIGAMHGASPSMKALLVGGPFTAAGIAIDCLPLALGGVVACTTWVIWSLRGDKSKRGRKSSYAPKQALKRAANNRAQKTKRGTGASR